MKQLSRIILPLFAALTLAFAACTNMFSPPSGFDEGSDARTGEVTISVSDNIPGSRTIYPTARFDYYKVIFETDDGDLDPVADAIIAGTDTSALITLQEGVWNITVKGYVTIDGEDYVAAQGSVTDHEIIYAESSTLNVPITISSLDDADDDGYFSYSVTVPAGSISATLTYDVYGGTNPITVDLDIGANSDKVSLAPGYYLVTVTLVDGYQIASKTEIVHIHSLFTSEWSPELTFVPFITLGGTINLSVNGEAADNLRIEAHTTGIGYTLEGIATITGNEWVIKIATFDEPTDLVIYVYSDGNLVYTEEVPEVESDDVTIDINEEAFITYTVTFNSNARAATVETAAVPDSMPFVYVSSNDDYKVTDLPAAPVLKTGWDAGMSFVGWNTSADGDGEAFEADFAVTDNITVYAQWAYTAGAFVDGVVVAPLMTTNQGEGGAQGTWHTNNTVNADGSVFFSGDADQYSGGAVRYTFPTGIEDYDFLTLDYVVDGTLSATLKQGTTGTDLTRLNGNQYPNLANGDVLSFAIKAVGYNSGIALARSNGSGNIKWTKATFTKGTRYTITFDANYASADPIADIKAVEGVAIGTLPSAGTHPDGYTFLGWYTAGDEAYTSSTVMPSDDLDLIAKWALPVVAPPITVDFSAGMFTNNNNSSVAIVNDGQGYTQTRTQGNNWTWSTFKITLETGVSLADYDTISFGILGTGDGEGNNNPTYKTVGVLAANSGDFPTTGSLASSLGSSLEISTRDGDGWNYSSGQQTLTFPINKINAAGLTGEIEICVYPDAGPLPVYTITNFQIWQTGNEPGSGGEPPPAAPAYFTDATGLTTGVATYGDTSNISFSGGIFTVNNPGDGGFGIAIDTPAGTASTDTVTITYALYVLDSGDAAWAVKQGSGWTDVSPASYPVFETGAVKTVDITMSSFTTYGTIYLQYNEYYSGGTLSENFQLKIIDVAIDGDGNGGDPGTDPGPTEDLVITNLTPTVLGGAASGETVSVSGNEVTVDITADSTGVGFYYSFPAGTIVASYATIEIEYTADVDGSSTAQKLIAKDGANSWNNPSTTRYIDIVDGDNSWTFDATTFSNIDNPGISFQVNVDGAAAQKYTFEVTKITLVAPTE